MKRRFAALLLVGVFAGCADDTPTTIGGDLVPGGGIRTVEVILEPSQFLVEDTSLVGFIKPAESNFQLIAEDFGGILDAHALYRGGALPRAVTFRIRGDSVRNDTLPTFPSGRLIVRTDSANSSGESAVLALHGIVQEWDPRTATWELAFDSASRREPWRQPGGTRSMVIDTALWEPGADSVVFSVDSLSLAQLTDTSTLARGALIRSETPGVRIRAVGSYLALNARPSTRPDTLVDAAVALDASTFVFTPEAPSLVGGELRVGGVPAYRSFIRFNRGVKNLVVGDCPVSRPPTSSPLCVPLSRASIGYAALLLQPLPVPEAFRQADSLQADVRGVLESEFLPLARSPLSRELLGRLRRSVPPSAFQAGTERVELPITDYLSRFVRDTTTATTSATIPDLIALIGAPEGTLFGFGSFAGIGSPAAPRLRLVLTLGEQGGIR